VRRLRERAVVLLACALCGCGGTSADSDAAAAAPARDAAGPAPGDASFANRDGSTSSSVDTGADPPRDDASVAESDAGAPPPPTRDCASMPVAGLLLCEDFESGEIDSTVWTRQTEAGGTLAVETGRVHDGTHALHLTLPAVDSGTALLVTRAPFPVPGNHFFGRALVWMSAPLPDTHDRVLGALGILRGGTADYHLDMNRGEMNSRYRHPSITTHGGIRQDGYFPATERWLCIEWEYDGSRNAMQYWFDGTLEPTMVVDGTESPLWEAPVFERFEIGLSHYLAPTNAARYDVYIDSVVLATARIGCS